MCAANHHEREKHPRVKRNVLPASNRNERNPAGCAISARSFNAKVVHATTLLLVIICGGVGGWVVCGWRLCGAMSFVFQRKSWSHELLGATAK